MENQSTFKELLVCNLGLIDYKSAWDIQLEYHEKRRNNLVPDILFLCEHPNTYTLGKVAQKENLLYNEKDLKEKNIDVYEIDRGGDITYHGPGQVVGYAILNLENWKKDTHLYLRSLEEVIIKTNLNYGINSGRNEKFTGVWIENRKICAIGIKVSRWITMHGFAYNVNTQLNLFEGIIPCGISDKEVTSLQKELKTKIDIEEVKMKVINNFKMIFEYSNITLKSIDELQN
ncbi:MAG: lipoyl(octanoyl) transferase LipB [Ignavibacteriales bacterium]|nr:lipoyl(octanoyl) transferase LipB [Ignavibacteriales bacterium]MCB9218776.1 lipoyl(octanoyl) transferase LipB [Ignavibacteriales bacterium]MCB9259220.1 lipoyl(octanoyl) transferase LipB [Ignavibacteriales bacterium]